MKYSLLLLMIFLASQVSYAELPDYEAPQILARANIRDGYNLPPLSYLSDTNPVINNRGDVTFRIMAVEGQSDQAIWAKTFEDDNGKIMYVAPDQRLITDPSISDTGMIAFNLHDEGVTDGLFVLDTKTLDVEQVLTPDNLPIQFYTYPQIKNTGNIFFRATDDFNDRSYYEFNGAKLTKIFAEGVESSGIKSSYLFRPAVNDSGVIAFKTRLGEKGEWDERNHDQIAVIAPSTDVKNPGPKFITIAKDRDSDPKSPYLGFGNAVSISNQGIVAFMGVLPDLKKVIVIAQNGNLLNIATEGMDGISELEMFAPKVNEQGEVAFRAKDAQGRRGLYVADQTGVKRIIGEGDEIMTDLGTGKILSNPNYPGFGGDIDINDHGEIVFYCILVDDNNRELGSAVYKVGPKK